MRSKHIGPTAFDTRIGKDGRCIAGESVFLDERTRRLRSAIIRSMPGKLGAPR